MSLTILNNLVDATEDLNSFCALKKGDYLILKGNPFKTTPYSDGIDEAMATLEFTLVRCLADYDKTTDPKELVKVQYYSVPNGDPSGKFYALNKKNTGKKNAPWLDTVKRETIAITDVSMMCKDKKLSGKTRNVSRFFIACKCYCHMT